MVMINSSGIQLFGGVSTRPPQVVTIHKARTFVQLEALPSIADKRARCQSFAAQYSARICHFPLDERDQPVEWADDEPTIETLPAASKMDIHVSCAKIQELRAEHGDVYVMAPLEGNIQCTNGDVNVSGTVTGNVRAANGDVTITGSKKRKV